MSDNWHERATCRRPWVKQEWFFPQDTDKTNDAGEVQQEYGDDGLRARLICSQCPVRQLCWEENRDAEVGVFAGTTEQERLRMLNTTRRREQINARAEKRPTRPTTWANLPRPGIVFNLAQGDMTDSLIRRHASGLPVISVRLQMALYGFMRGLSVESAATEADVKPALFRKHITPLGRIAS